MRVDTGHAAMRDCSFRRERHGGRGSAGPALSVAPLGLTLLLLAALAGCAEARPAAFDEVRLSAATAAAVPAQPAPKGRAAGAAAGTVPRAI